MSITSFPLKMETLSWKPRLLLLSSSATRSEAVSSKKPYHSAPYPAGPSAQRPRLASRVSRVGQPSLGRCRPPSERGCSAKPESGLLFPRRLDRRRRGGRTSQVRPPAHPSVTQVHGQGRPAGRPPSALASRPQRRPGVSGRSWQGRQSPRPSQTYGARLTQGSQRPLRRRGRRSSGERVALHVPAHVLPPRGQ